MAWSAPRTWVTGELVTAAIMNQHIRDNLVQVIRPQDAVSPQRLLKWGLYSATTDGGGNTTVTFSSAFPTAIDSVVAVGRAATTVPIFRVHTESAAGFTIFWNSASVAVAASWVAVGN